MTRAGFALPLVLVVVAALSVLAGQTAGRARVALAQERLRIVTIEARWVAEGCVARFRAAMASAESLGADRVLRLDDCQLAVRPVGMAVPISGSDSAWISTLVRVTGRSAATADSMVAAWLDWQDADDHPRPRGAESSWYDEKRRARPRNEPLRAVDELARIRGFETFVVEVADRFPMTTDPDRLDLGVASADVLRTVPGANPAYVDAVLAARLGDRSPLDAGAKLIEGDPAELLRRAAPANSPEWDVTVSIIGPTADAALSLTVRLVRKGSQWAVEQHRTGIL